MGANDIQHGGDHYKGAQYQHWDWAWDCRLNGFAWAASKYVSRWRKKNGLEDLQKCEHYIDKALEAGATAGASSNHRYEFFWRFVAENNLNMVDASVCFYLMEGQLEQARAVVNQLIAGAVQGDRTSEVES